MTTLRFAFRTLFRTPLVTTVALLSLALGIGANAAIFSLLDQVLLRRVPVPDANRLVNLSAPGPKPGSQSCGQAGGCEDVFSYPMFRDLEKQQSVFTGIAAHRGFGGNLSYRGQIISGEGLEVSGSYFPILGLRPALGRLLEPMDDGPVGQPRVVVLAYDFWQTRFGANPAVLNDQMLVNGQSLTIVGVAPKGFEGTTLGNTPKVFVPITIKALMEPNFADFDNRRSYWAYLFARLKPGVTMAAASTSLNVPYRSIINTVEAPLQKGMSPATLARFRARALTLVSGARGQSSLPEDARAPLVLLQAVAAVVLIIACANIANLLLARSAARAGEMAIRLSIGASRTRLVRQLLGESMLLALIGGAAGLLVALLTLKAIVAWLLPPDATRLIATTIDLPTLLFTAAAALGTGVLFGLFPAIHSTRPNLALTLKSVSGQPSGAKSAAWFRAALVTSQIALSLALLAGAGLFVKNLVKLSHVDLGFQIDRVLTFGVTPQRNGYTAERTRTFLERLENELSSTPGVSSAAVSVIPLLSGDNWGSSMSIQGQTPGPDTDTSASVNEVGPAFFRTLGIPLVAGREFARADRLGAPKVAIVNEAFCRKFHLAPPVVGLRIGSRGKELDTEIVGVARDARYSDVKKDPPPEVYTPYAQDEQFAGGSIYVRTAVDPAAIAAVLPGVVAKLDANLPIEDLKTLPDQVHENVFEDRMIMSLAAVFAVLATLLAAVGLYGVLAYAVSQRTREFGLRMALGADPRHVRGLVLRQVALMTLVGGGVGLAAAAALGTFAQSELYQMNGWDPSVLTAAAALLTAIAFAAGFLPAARAARIDPMRALRYE